MFFDRTSETKSFQEEPIRYSMARIMAARAFSVIKRSSWPILVGEKNEDAHK